MNLLYLQLANPILTTLKHYPMHQSEFESKYRYKKCLALRRVIGAIIPILLFALGAYSEPVQGELAMPIEEIILEGSGAFHNLEQIPQFPNNSEIGLLKWVQSNLKYPEVAKKNGVQGRVVVQFLIKKDGSIEEIKIYRSRHPALDEEAIRIVKTFPKFIPGKRNGVPVDMWYTLPIDFKLPEAEK